MKVLLALVLGSFLAVFGCSAKVEVKRQGQCPAGKSCGCDGKCGDACPCPKKDDCSNGCCPVK